MNPSLTPYFLAIGANIAFGTATLVFSRFARSHSPSWVNRLKVAVALIGFIFAFLLTEHWVALSPMATLLLMGSGFLGLCLGDLFLFRAFADLGPARTLVLYSFQPLLLGIYGYFFLSQSISISQFFAILCMIGCVLVFLLERNRLTGSWHFLPFLGAFLGIVFDAIGVMLTRSAYEITPHLDSFQTNAVRAAAAVVGFILLSPRAYPQLWKDLTRLSTRDRRYILGACFLGTFLSLALYLEALKTAHVATLTSIAITGPVWVSIIEHVMKKELPNRYLSFAFVLFLGGFLLLALN